MDRQILMRSAARPTSHPKRQMLLLTWLMLAAVVVQSQPPVKCPDQCFCHRYYSPEDGPSLHTECTQGGMRAIPVDHLDKTINQLRITPPPDKPNFLTIGPILTQPVPFSQLRDLSIVNSNVPSIGQYAFWGLHNLKTLNLTGNNLTSIAMDNFRGLINLVSLYLDYNNIEQMASETFRHCTALKSLSLSNNKISALVPRLFRMLAKLITLNLSFNPLNDLNPDVFKDIQQLTIFKCRRCSLSRINTQIYHLAPLIEELDLGENLFKYFTADEFISLKKLKKLQLDGNQIAVIVDYVFGQNREMLSLELAHNRLALLTPGSLTNLTRLQSLDISYNKLDKFHLQAFAPVVNSLKSLDLSGNNLPLKEIAILLQILPGIESIGMANLSLKDIPSNFFMYSDRLKTLDISSNQLTMFPYQLLKRIRILQELNISENKINTLNDMDLRRLEAVPEINLSGNPWTCDQCSVETMLVYMKTTVLNSSLRYLRCHSPLRVRGVRLADLTTDMLEPCPFTYEAQISAIAAVVLVLVAVLAVLTTAVCWTHRCGAQYYTNEEKRRRHDQDHPEELLDHSQNGNVATINAPYQHVPNCS